MYKGLDIKVQKKGPLWKDDRVLVTENPFIISKDTKDIMIDLMSDNILVEYIYESVEKYKKQGASWSDIKEYIRLAKLNVTEEDICKSLDRLLEAKLIQITGFECLRYVAAEHMSAWMLTKSGSHELLHPFMWHDVSGQVIEPAFKGCAETVLSHIVKLPGISFVSTFKRKTYTGNLIIFLRLFYEKNSKAF